MDDSRNQAADQFLRRFAAALRSAQLYSARHPIILRNRDALATAVETLHGGQPAVTIGGVGPHIVVGELPVGRTESFADLTRRLQSAGIERVVIDRGVVRDELASFVQALAAVEGRKNVDGTLTEFPPFPHIRVGRIESEERV